MNKVGEAMWRLKLLTLIVVGLLVQAGLGSSFAAAPRIALVIGNSAYAEAPLANPANDARLIASTLRNLGFEVMERIDVDRDTMQYAIVEFGERLDKAGKDAVGLFYYAGHGVQVGGQNYLIPLKVRIEKESHVQIQAVSAGWVLGEMEYASNRMNFIILDACRNNPLTRRFRSPIRGLANMNPPRGSLLAYSTAPGKLARDGEGPNSPYTEALAKALLEPGVPAEKMFKRVRDLVMAETNDEQVPWEESSLTGADFYFNSAKVSEAPVPTTPRADIAAQVEQETAFWQSIKDSTDPALFEAYLRRYPEGAFADIARIQRDKLAAPPAALEPEPEEAEEAETALLAPAPSVRDAPMVARDIENSEMLKSLIKEHYNNLKVLKMIKDPPSGYFYLVVEMTEILNLSVLDFDRDRARVKVRYRWEERDTNATRV